VKPSKYQKQFADKGIPTFTFDADLPNQKEAAIPQFKIVCMAAVYYNHFLISKIREQIHLYLHTINRQDKYSHLSYYPEKET